MKKVLVVAACAALMGGVANAADLTLDIQYNSGTQQIEIYALVTPVSPEGGLALLGVDLESDSTEAFNALSPDLTSAVAELQKDAGLTNPGVNAYWGTASGNNLLQLGGAQNTIDYDGLGGPSYPTGTVNPTLATSNTVIARYNVNLGGLTADATYTLNNAFANSIDDASGGPVYAVSAITNITYTNQSVLVPYSSDTIPPEFAAVAEPVKSWKDHGPNAGNLYINLPVAATTYNVGVETRENSVTKITIEMNEAIQLPALTDIVMCGCAHGPYNPIAVSLDGTGTILTTDWSGIPNGQQTSAPLTQIGDGLGDRYLLKLDEVKDIAGNRMGDGSDSDVELIALFGNVENVAFLSRYKVNSIDLNNVLLNFQGTAGNPGVYTNQASAKYDVLCYLSFLSRGKVNSVDYNITQVHFAVGGTVCGTFTPDPACPSPPY